MLLLGIASTSATGADAQQKQAIALTGHYYLDGMAEVGSEILLNDNGRFEWNLAYGAVDMYAQGKWQRNEYTLTLTVARPEKAPPFSLLAEHEVRLKRPVEEGVWIADVGFRRGQFLAGVEVQFESESGQTATALTDYSGRATVSMPGTETWRRAGLRMASLKGD